MTLEMYNVYAGLKRSGYVVFRTGTWDEDRGDILGQGANSQHGGTRDLPSSLASSQRSGDESASLRTQSRPLACPSARSSSQDYTETTAIYSV